MVELNENQLKAIKHKDGPMLVFSGPGSGKTTVITQRLIYMVENYGINPRDILTITFTKAAAEEMESRYISAGGKKGSNVFNISRIILQNFKKLLWIHCRYDNIRKREKGIFIENG